METDALIVKVASEITLLSTLSIFITQLLDKKGQAGALMMNGLKCLLSSRCFVFIHLKYFVVLLSHDPFHTNSTILLCIVLLCTVYCITVLLYITVINQHHKYWSYWIFILYFAGTSGFLRFSVCVWGYGGVTFATKDLQSRKKEERSRSWSGSEESTLHIQPSLIQRSIRVRGVLSSLTDVVLLLFSRLAVTSPAF